MGIEFKSISALLTCEQFAQSEMMPIRGKRTRCVFHGGTHFNLTFLDDGKCRCFVCGRVADVIDLAATYWRMSKYDAAVELNQRFHLGLSESMPTAERVQQLSARDQLKRDAQNKLDEARAEAEAAWDLVKQCQADTPEHAEAVKQARNADVWVQFKRVEARQAGVNVT